jgi:cytosine/uracil/thiamine/allantoin permease
MRGLIYAKLIVFIISAIAMCAWTLSLAGGIGEVARQPGTAHGSAKTWLIVRFFLLGAASCATFASNAADFQRYASKPNDVLLGNLIGFPLSNVSSSSPCGDLRRLTTAVHRRCSRQSSGKQQPSPLQQNHLVAPNLP